MLTILVHNYVNTLQCLPYFLDGTPKDLPEGISGYGEREDV